MTVAFPDADLIAERNVLDKPGSAVLPPNASGLERAMADTDVERLIRIADEIIVNQWDPYKISLQNLPYLAWAMACNLWEDDYWNEGTKRDWAARNWTFLSMRGAPKAFEMALAQSGYEITDMLRPPQGFYASPDLTKEEQDAWIRQMPEIRIYWADRQGTSGLDEIFVDGQDSAGQWANCGFCDQDAISIDDGFALRGRYAIMRQRGVDTPLQIIQYTPDEEESPVIDFERVSTIGRSTLGLFSDEDFVDDDRYVCAEEVEPYLMTIRLDRSYSHDASKLSLTTIRSGLTPITPRYERDSDVGNGGAMMFEGDFADDIDGRAVFADREDGGEWLLADRIYLLDPNVEDPIMPGISFSDYSRVGIPVRYAELMIDLKTSESTATTFCEDFYAEASYTVEEDDSHRERAFRAVIAAKALGDTIAVSFAPRRQLEMGDFLETGSRYSDWKADAL